MLSNETIPFIACRTTLCGEYTFNDEPVDPLNGGLIVKDTEPFRIVLVNTAEAFPASRSIISKIANSTFCSH